MTTLRPLYAMKLPHSGDDRDRFNLSPHRQPRLNLKLLNRFPGHARNQGVPAAANPHECLRRMLSAKTASTTPGRWFWMLLRVG